MFLSKTHRRFITLSIPVYNGWDKIIGVRENVRCRILGVRGDSYVLAGAYGREFSVPISEAI